VRALIGFLRFWWDFIVGDAPAVAVGVVLALLAAWALTRSGAHGAAWLLLPLGVGAALGGSLLWQARGRGRP
jgi:hypothetical protein